MAQSMEERASTLLKGLTPPQRDAVTHTDGPLLILAGPGSGKTRVITHRAVHLVRTVASPREILAVTFTNKAANEMRERIESLGVARGMTVCTFHSACAMLLRIHHERAGVARNFTILDRDDRRKVVKEAVELCDLSPTNWSPARVESDISNAKNALLTPQAWAESGVDWRSKTIVRIYEAYDSLLRKYNALDFDDLLMLTAMMLRRDTELRDQLESRWRYVLIDEYQDTNEAQYQIARMLTKTNQNLCATGDPDQSIYGWRGANIENILSFERDYPTAKVVRLEQNYRSTQNILLVADALISGNRNRKEKALWTENEEGARVRGIQRENQDDEASMIAEDIAARVAEGGDASEVAIFYRTNSLSRPLEEALIRRGIRYQIARGLEFYNRKEIKDVLAYLRVLVNPRDEVALLRIINTPVRGIGATTIRRLLEKAHQDTRVLHELIVGEDDLSFLGRSARNVEAFRDLLRGLAQLVEAPPQPALERVVQETGLGAMYRQVVDVATDPMANIEELISAAAVYQKANPEATLIDWLEHTALVSDLDAVDAENEAVTLMTLHAAKGLEFPTVYIIGLEDGLLPFRRNEDEEGDIEEERRLCFVGMTRAQRELTLSYARYRMVRGITTRTVRSPFLDELPRAKIEWHRLSDSTPGSRGDSEGELPEDVEAWTMGSLVRHPLYGLGKLVGFERGHRHTNVTVRFEDGGERSFVLEFAELTRVDYYEVD